MAAWKISPLLAVLLLAFAGAQPSPRRRAPMDDRRRFSPPSDDRRRTFDDRRRSFDDRRRSLDDRRRYSPPAPPPIICAPHCLTCTVSMTCDICMPGYVKNLLFGMCDACGPHCFSCMLAGAGNCDSAGCKKGSVWVKGSGAQKWAGTCQPCDPNCESCDSAGAGACDPGKCNQGFGNSSTGCGPCTPNCNNCLKVGASSCDAGQCSTGYGNNRTECGLCTSNCNSCSKAGAGSCDVGQCSKGYGNNRTECGPCTASCNNCDTAGAGSCNDGSCADRFTNDGSKCSPCGDNCTSCTNSGPHLCDQCVEGFYRNDTGTCLQCSEHCRNCNGLGSSGDSECTSCWSPYTARDGKCSLLPLRGSILAALAASLGFCCCGSGLALKKCRRQVEAREMQRPLTTELGFPVAPPLANGSSRGAPSPAPDVHLPPSGTWRGYYVYERVNHDVCEFNLQFLDDGSVRGNGVDDVGAYDISGKLDRSRTGISFNKKYRRGTRNHLGFVNEDNEGHTVVYTGRLPGDSLGAGFRGTWKIRNSGTNSDGRFHLWPAMEFQPSAPPPAQVFQVAEDGECVICYERAITTCLQPCGHMAMCQQCVSQLPAPRACPICRSRIQSVLIAGSGPEPVQALRLA